MTREQNGQNWQQKVINSIDIYGQHPAICETTDPCLAFVTSTSLAYHLTRRRIVPAIIVPWKLQQRCIYPAKVSHGTWKWHPGIEDSFLNTIIFGFHVKLGECNESCSKQLQYTTETDSKKTLKISHPKRKKSSSNHPFLVSGRVTSASYRNDNLGIIQLWTQPLAASEKSSGNFCTARPVAPDDLRHSKVTTCQRFRGPVLRTTMKRGFFVSRVGCPLRNIMLHTKQTINIVAKNGALSNPENYQPTKIPGGCTSAWTIHKLYV